MNWHIFSLVLCYGIGALCLVGVANWVADNVEDLLGFGAAVAFRAGIVVLLLAILFGLKG
ncbi:hypothetical protein [Lysobacter sp. Root96]|uniref:hypothetical protein n=1 Tax=Lysobacter sp. Root96 TaxID=1736612 RepID=UPI0007001A73|nr:hypothetical protein [Lysobacter sp. Root96]KRD71427.1 hypothetical protein ASE45_06350 [Lysobacter sp. Root96]